MKKYCLVFLLVIYCLVLTACSPNEEDVYQKENSYELDNTNTIQDEEIQQEASSILKADYEDLGGSIDDSYLFALGFVGAYADMSEKVMIENAAEFADSYLEEEYSLVFMEGGELYVIIPKYEGTTITVRSVDTKGAENVVGKVADTTNNTLFVMCNPSDLRSNVEITVTYRDMESIFSPSISLKDGTLNLPDYAMKIIN